MTKVFFLDLDGPVFPETRILMESESFQPYPGKIDHKGWITYWKADPLFVHFFNSLMDTYRFKTVLSTSWAKVLPLELVQEVLSINGIDIDYHDDPTTPEHFPTEPYALKKSNRAWEIQAWLDNHPEVSDYIILDDPWSGDTLNEPCHNLDKDKIFLVNPDVGLDTDTIKDIRYIVHNQWAKQVTPLW